MTEPPAAANARPIRGDLASAYAVTAARTLGWVLVSAAVYRKLGANAFAVASLARVTVGLLSYTSLGLGPAMVRMLAGPAGRGEPVRVLPVGQDDGPFVPGDVSPVQGDAPPVLGDISLVPSGAPLVTTDAPPVPGDGSLRPPDAPRGDFAVPPQPAAVLTYADQDSGPEPDDELAVVYTTGEGLALLLGFAALLLGAAYALQFTHLHAVPLGVRDEEARALVLMLGVGLGFRVMSEAPSGLLQARGRIALDNVLLAAAELATAVATAVAVSRGADLFVVGGFACLGSLALLVGRSIAGRLEVGKLTSHRGAYRWPVARRLLSFGGLVVLAQAADFLYAPTDCILINRFVSPAAVAVYAPAIQIDAGLLLLVTGMAAVLFPRTATAHAAGDRLAVRRYYVRGTLAGVAMLAPAALATWALSPILFRVWFGDDLPETRAILPLVLVHTVVGGGGAVGRSVLLGMGKVRPFAASVLVAGAANVFLSYAFVRHLHWGLRGIILGTIVVVVARAGLWMPWYVLRALARADAAATSRV